MLQNLSDPDLNVFTEWLSITPVIYDSLAEDCLSHSQTSMILYHLLVMSLNGQFSMHHEEELVIHFVVDSLYNLLCLQHIPSPPAIFQ